MLYHLKHVAAAPCEMSVCAQQLPCCRAANCNADLVIWNSCWKMIFWHHMKGQSF